MPADTLSIAVVGHTNVGKTSLMRTLARDNSFGDVASSPGTTRSVESLSIGVGQGRIDFFDTPGLEDSAGVLAHLKQNIDAGIDWVEAITALSSTSGQAHDFSQEGKALRQVITSDILLYVIDVRDQVRAKHRDELEILMRCGKPIVAVLNFVAQSTDGEASWRETLARTNIHAIAPFDTVVYSQAGEAALYEKARTQLDQFAPLISQRLEDIAAGRRSQVQASAMAIARFAVDLGGLEESVAVDDAQAREHKAQDLKVAAQRAEAKAQKAIINAFDFGDDVVELSALDVDAGLWEADVFDPETLANFGLNTTAAAATGAAIGLGVDVLVGGLSLGAAAVTGALLGTGFDAVRRYGQDIRNRLAGRATLKLNAQSCALMLARQTALLRALVVRGHGAQETIDKLPTGPLVDAILPIAKNALKGKSSDAFLAETAKVVSDLVKPDPQGS
ncbi:MAG: GTPase/DUF3482 domain-containing protein [Pseudomonadota bacterium]